MVIATPIRDGSLNTVGVLAARLNLKRFFTLINDATGLGETGETVVARRDGNRVVLTAPTRHDADAALVRSLPLGAPAGRALQEAVRGQSGAGVHADYRGVKAFAAWQYVPSLEWGLTAKVDYEEAMRGMEDIRNQMALIVGIIIMLIVPAAILTARALVRPLRELKDATDRLSRGDFGVEVNIRSGDEIGDLAQSFERMVAATKFFREHSRSADEGADPESDAASGKLIE
jgi:methyl-accepting chemotaxis protein WspA